jgi:hypothetical protein
MNERIKQFAQQAGFKVDWQHADVQDIKMARFEKFAELIVREMCDVFDKRAEPNTGFYEPHEPAELIKEHFGVE